MRGNGTTTQRCAYRDKGLVRTASRGGVIYSVMFLKKCQIGSKFAINEKFSPKLDNICIYAIIMSIPFAFLKAQNDHEKGMVISCINCGFPKGEQLAHYLG